MICECEWDYIIYIYVYLQIITNLYIYIFYSGKHQQPHCDVTGRTASEGNHPALFRGWWVTKYQDYCNKDIIYRYRLIDTTKFVCIHHQNRQPPHAPTAWGRPQRSQWVLDPTVGNLNNISGMSGTSWVRSTITWKVSRVSMYIYIIYFSVDLCAKPFEVLAVSGGRHHCPYLIAVWRSFWPFFFWRGVLTWIRPKEIVIRQNGDFEGDMSLQAWHFGAS